jgi:hypothetical protein
MHEYWPRLSPNPTVSSPTPAESWHTFAECRALKLLLDGEDELVGTLLEADRVAQGARSFQAFPHVE